jgi:hypothetical protein
MGREWTEEQKQKQREKMLEKHKKEVEVPIPIVTTPEITIDLSKITKVETHQAEWSTKKVDTGVFAKLPEDSYIRFKVLAVQRGQAMKEAILEAVEMYISKYEKGIK